MRNWFIEITRVSYDKQFWDTTRVLYFESHFHQKYFCLKGYLQSMCSKISRWAHWKVFAKVSVNPYPRTSLIQCWIAPLLLSSCHLIIDPRWISHVTYQELEWFRSRSISIFIVNIFISLGCSGNTTRIMRRTLNILSYFPHCVKQ